DLGALQIGRERKREVVAFHRTGDIHITQLTRVMPGQLLGVLLQRDGRRAGAGVGLDRERPLAGQVDLRALRPRNGRADDGGRGGRQSSTNQRAHAVLLCLTVPMSPAIRSRSNRRGSRRSGLFCSRTLLSRCLTVSWAMDWTAASTPSDPDPRFSTA